MDHTLESLYWRYAVKKFDPARVLPEEKVTRLTNAFNLTATSYGLQPIRLLVIQDKALQRSLVPYSYGQRQVADASHVLVICVETEVDTSYIQRYFDKVQSVRGTSAEILKPYRDDLVGSFSKKTPEQIRMWAVQQAYLALGNLLTVCAVERIDSCPMEGFVPEAYDRILGLTEKGLTAVLVLPVGYRAADDMFSGLKKVRRDLKDTIIRIQEEPKEQ